MTEQKPKRKSAKAKPAEAAEQPKAPAPQTNHTILELCRAGTAYKSAVADVRYIKHRASIQRATAAEVDAAEERMSDAYVRADAMHSEFLKQEISAKDRAFATDHMRALNDVS